MLISEIMIKKTEFWKKNPPVRSSALQKLTFEADTKLPTDYLAFLEFSNGGEGPLRIKPGWFSLWPAEDVIVYNNDYGVKRNCPGFFGFGSNGGDELFAFDTKSSLPWKIYMIPFIGMEEGEAILIAKDFISLIEAIGV